MAIILIKGELMKKAIGLFFTVSAVLFTSCGGKDSGATGSSSSSVDSQVSSQFIDAPVKGLNYTSTSNSGTTGTSGAFSCTLGEEVTFKIGDREIGAAPCGSKIFIDDLNITTAKKNAWGAVLQAYLSSDVITLPDAVTNATSVPDLTGTNDGAVTTFFTATSFSRPSTVTTADARTHINSAVTSNISLSSSITDILDEMAWFTSADGNSTDPDSSRYDIDEDLHILKNENTDCEVDFYISLYVNSTSGTKRYYVYPYVGTGGSHQALNGADGVMVKSDYFSTKFDVTVSGDTYSGNVSLYLDTTNQKIKGRMKYTVSDGSETESCSAVINETVSVD